MPDARSIVTPWMPPEPIAREARSYWTGTWSCRRSHAASRRVEGESAAPATSTAVIGSYGGWSSTAASTAASWARHRVRRVQAKSVSPGV